MTTVYLHALLLALLLTAKLSRYLLSLLLASVLFFAGSESLSESQILLLLTAETQKQQHTHSVTTCQYLHLFVHTSDLHTSWEKHKVRPVRPGFIYTHGAIIYTADGSDDCVWVLISYFSENLTFTAAAADWSSGWDFLNHLPQLVHKKLL